MARFLVLVLLISFISSGSVFADESLFGYSYTSETIPKGNAEFAVWLTQRWDKGLGSYNASDIPIEFEYGVTDRFNVAAYIIGLRLRADGAFPPDINGEEVYPTGTINENRIAAYKSAFKYNFLSPYKHWAGFAINTEVIYVRWFSKVDGAKTRQFSLEPVFIVQKNFLDDQLVTTYNLALESEWREFPADPEAQENEFSITNSVGITYRFFRNVYIGIEARHHQDVLNGFTNHHDFFMGPNFHYTTKKWYVTVAYLRQIHGNPTYSAYDVDPALQNGKYHYEEDTMNELRFKFGYNISFGGKDNSEEYRK